MGVVVLKSNNVLMRGLSATTSRENLTPMSANSADSQQRGDPPPATLGEIVLAGSRPAPKESEWESLVRSIAQGDERALHALYGRTHRIVFTLILRITRNADAAEELTVDVFHDIWRRAPEYDARSGSVVGWVMNLARSQAVRRGLGNLRQARGSEVKR